MPTTLSSVAVEKSTYVVVAAFTDENGDAVAPTTLTWTLTDSEGNIRNSRENVEVSSPSSSENIVLSGKDLALKNQGNYKEDRILKIHATYTSSYGSGLPLRASCRFSIVNLKAVS